MNKTIKTTLALVIALSTGYGVYTSQQKSELSELALANIEALAMGEANKCDNANGYRRILEGDERIYDCCYQEKIGKGKEDCKRW
ncbi:NVEALA domain-containing protein [Phocaeicola coprophilus]|uniref:NVEALA domain-containing protein n=1 Tax=Phocaeicola coprophilus TaxID=387090 RepID=UPI0026DB1186|nr:NVEALA domain-containing protein [Phocaeicola coprophilus]